MAEVKLKDRADFIDGEALRRDLSAAAHAIRGDTAALRKEALRLLKTTLSEARAKIRARLEAGASGPATARALCRVQDVIIQALYDFVAHHVYPAPNPTEAERISIVAVGGYGRGMLAPGSDIDLLFLLPYKQTPWGESAVEFMLYLLWDLGLKVGHATRSVNECIRLSKSDITIRTAVLEARYLWGERKLFDGLKARFDKEVVSGTGGDFVDAKLAERNARHKAAGAVRYMVEPNLKEGKGGLRDLNTLFWIGKYLYHTEDTAELVDHGVYTSAELRVFQKAEAFLWLVRCHLHFMTGRAEERLSFDVQRELAKRLGYGDDPQNKAVERFMTDYFRVVKDVGDLTRIFYAALEEQHRKTYPVIERVLSGFSRRRTSSPGLVIDGGRVNITSLDAFEKDPVDLLRLFAVADERGVHIHPNALREATRSLGLIDEKLRANPEANKIFLSILCSRRDPERILRWMNESGVLGAFIPEFNRIVARMQFNMYHHYTVDEHLIRAIGALSQIERGELADQHPLANEIIHKIHAREVLYLALFLHDIAKGSDRDHSEGGEEIAKSLGPRLALSAADTETVAWLVRNHLVMSDVAQRRDLSDPKTVRDFVAVVQSPERLKLLLCLTVADIRAVGPGVFNGWKGQLLRELYYAAEAMMLGSHAEGTRARRVSEAKAALAESLGNWPEVERRAVLDRHYDPYWLTFDTDVHERHARLMRAADSEERTLTIETASDAWRAVTEVTVYTPDDAGLFSRIAGGIAVAGASIVDAKVFTTIDGMALDTFWIQDANGGPFAEAGQIARLKDYITRTLSGDIVPRTIMDARRIKTREEAFRVEPRVIVDNEASDMCTVIEVNGRDRPGLLHDLTRALFVSKLTIHSAHIATYGERAVDVFYVKDLYGHKIHNEQKRKSIEENLTQALGDGGVRAMRPPKREAGSSVQPPTA